MECDHFAVRLGLLLLLALPLLAQDDPLWRDALARAEREQKPIVVLYKSPDCVRCELFAVKTLPHPTIERRLPSVVFVMLPASEPGVAFFDRSGVQRAHWPMVPDTINFGVILDSVIEVAPYFERALQRSGPEADIELAIGYTALARTKDAQAALARIPVDSPLRRRLVMAPPREVAQQALIQLLSLDRQAASGRQSVRTNVTSAAVARVVFSLDGKEVARVKRPPFSTTIDFGAVPERHVIRAVAFDRNGKELGRDERIVNEAGETFWLRITDPRGGSASGAVRVSMNVRVPPAQRIERVVVSWNDAERAVLKSAPFEATIKIPQDQLGVLRAVAELDDGRTSEDAVLLNARGFADQSSVMLVQLPITVLGATQELSADRITVREGNKVRRVESIANAAETPLTVGLLIDASDSVEDTLPDLQEAAIRFLDAVLGERDRAFLISFDSRARVLQPPTPDKELLRRQVMSIRPDGLTALYDAMALGLLQFEGVKGRRAMIVFTDGIDVTSGYSAKEAAELARRVNVPIHAIAPLRVDDLQSVARSTGGTPHAMRSFTELPGIYAQIEAALRTQMLAFVRTDPATRENEWRNVKVEVGGRDVEVFAPAGYYAPW